MKQLYFFLYFFFLSINLIFSQAPMTIMSSEEGTSTMDFITYDTTTQYFLVAGVEHINSGLQVYNEKRLFISTYDTLGNEVNTFYKNGLVSDEIISYIEKIEDEVYIIKTHFAHDCYGLYRTALTYFSLSSGTFTTLPTPHLADYMRFEDGTYFQVMYEEFQPPTVFQYLDANDSIIWTVSLDMDVSNRMNNGIHSESNNGIYRKNNGNIVYYSNTLLTEFDRLDGTIVTQRDFGGHIIDAVYFQGSHYFILQQFRYNRVNQQPKLLQVDDNFHEE